MQESVPYFDENLPKRTSRIQQMNIKPQTAKKFFIFLNRLTWPPRLFNLKLYELVANHRLQLVPRSKIIITPCRPTCCVPYRLILSADLMSFSSHEFQWVCKGIAIALHYFFLVAFAWMALEGVMLYLMLVKVFHTKTAPAKSKKIFFCLGWGENCSPFFSFLWFG